MSEHASGKAPLHGKVIEEFKALAAVSAYLYICLGAVILFKSAVLREVGVTYAIWGVALVKAIILGKFMLLLRMAHIGERHRNKPLIWPTLYQSLMFLVMLLILTTFEELFVGLIHGRALTDSLAHVVGPTFYQGFSVCFLMFLILIPYSAYACLGDVLGERELFRLFFVDRSASTFVRDRLGQG